MRKILSLLILSLFLTSCLQTKIDKTNSGTTNTWNQKELNSGKTEKVSLNSGKTEKISSNSGKTDEKNINSNDDYILNLVWDEPFWNITIDKNKLAFSAPNSLSIVWCREKDWYFFCERDVAIEKKWEEYVFKAKDVKWKIYPKDCFDLAERVYKYSVDVTFNDEKKVEWCWEEKQAYATWDNTFKNGQKGKTKDLEKALGISVTDDLKAGNYTVEDIYGYYAIFSLDNFNLIEDKKSWKSSDNKWKNVLLVMKKTDKWWKQIWKIWESYRDTCENVANESTKLWDLSIFEGCKRLNPG